MSILVLVLNLNLGEALFLKNKEREKMKKIISMLFATILVIGFTSSANAAKTLKCQTVLNTKADEVKMLKDFTDTVTTLTGGSLKFEI